MSRERLFELAAAADEQLQQFGSTLNAVQRRYAPEDEQEAAAYKRKWDNRRTAATAGITAAAGATYGGMKLRNAVINRGGVVDDYGNMVARKGMYGAAAPQRLKKVVGGAEDYLNKNVPAAMEGGKQAARTGMKYVGRKLVRVGDKDGLLRKAGVGLLKKAKTFEAGQIERIVELAARIEELELEHEFADREQQRSKVGMYAAGGAPALYEQSRYKKSGLVYRKRDAVKDGVKGGAVGNLAGLATGAGIVGGAVGLGKLAATRRLPKGALRKIGIKAGRAVGGNKLAYGAMAAAGVAGMGAGLATMHGSAEKRRKALLKQRLEGGQG